MKLCNTFGACLVLIWLCSRTVLALEGMENLSLNPMAQEFQPPPNHPGHTGGHGGGRGGGRQGRQGSRRVSADPTIVLTRTARDNTIKITPLPCFWRRAGAAAGISKGGAPAEGAAPEAAAAVGAETAGAMAGVWLQTCAAQYTSATLTPRQVPLALCFAKHIFSVRAHIVQSCMAQDGF